MAVRLVLSRCNSHDQFLTKQLLRVASLSGRAGSPKQLRVFLMWLSVFCICSLYLSSQHLPASWKGQEGDIERGKPKVEARGPFLYSDEEKFLVKGVTYGTFLPRNSSGVDIEGPEMVLVPPKEKVRVDFIEMRAHGINCIRVYTPPPLWLLDMAEEYDLKVLVGLYWPQSTLFLDDALQQQEIRESIRTTVQSLNQHPAILMYAIANELPSSILRWYGAKRVADFLKEIHDIIKVEDHSRLVTVVNYPSNEYFLEYMPWLEVVAFNVYLEKEADLKAYFLRLQNLAGSRPVLLTETGLDSKAHGLEAQADVITWSVGAAFRAGLAGAFVFAWTDEWAVGSVEMQKWDFGLVTREREPKPALIATAKVFAGALFDGETVRSWPNATVVVCAYNNAASIRSTCEALSRLEYTPQFEVIVVDDGSSDETLAIVAGFEGKLPCLKVVQLEKNCGLSCARNAGLKHATGDIIAYTDGDAEPDSFWLAHLSHTFASNSSLKAVGGSCLAPGGDGPIAAAVARSPGGAMPVLTSDSEAEHIPGCNMAFRREALQAVGGFDKRFTIAGDDVDVCWRFQAADLAIGFSPAAIVWHHRRNSLQAYVRQQFNYGRAEGLLERKWLHKFNQLGYATWQGQMYGEGLALPLAARRGGSVEYGTWGTAAFQKLKRADPPPFVSYLPVLPEYWLIIFGFLLLTLLRPLPWQSANRVALCLLALSLFLGLFASHRNAGIALEARGSGEEADLSLVTSLHFVQPLARLMGRLWMGLTPWRFHTRGRAEFALPVATRVSFYDTQGLWYPLYLKNMETRLKREGFGVLNGGKYEKVDFRVHGGHVASVSFQMVDAWTNDSRVLIMGWILPEVPYWTLVIASLLLLLSTAKVTRSQRVILVALATWLLLVSLYTHGRTVSAVSRAFISNEQAGALGNDTSALDRSRFEGAGKLKEANESLAVAQAIRMIEDVKLEEEEGL